MEKLFKRLSSTALTVVCATLLLVGGVYAATTISSNISTAGTLDVTGNATTSANLVVGDTVWAAPTSTLSVVGTAHFFDLATSSTGFWVGSAGSAGNINMLGGDLYVQDDAEIDSELFVTGDARFSLINATTTKTDWALINTGATSTLYFMIGDSASVGNLNYDDDLYVKDDVEIDGEIFVTGDARLSLINATSTKTDALKVNGTITLANNETIANATNDNIYINSTGISLATSTATTTNGVWIGAQGGNSTSTLILGAGGSAGQDNIGPKGACIEMWREGLVYRIYIKSSGDDVKVEAGRCKD